MMSITISQNHPSQNGLPKNTHQIIFFRNNGAKYEKLKLFIKVDAVQGIIRCSYISLYPQFVKPVPYDKDFRKETDFLGNPVNAMGETYVIWIRTVRSPK